MRTMIHSSTYALMSAPTHNTHARKTHTMRDCMRINPLLPNSGENTCYGKSGRNPLMSLSPPSIRWPPLAPVTRSAYPSTDFRPSTHQERIYPTIDVLRLPLDNHTRIIYD